MSSPYREKPEMKRMVELTEAEVKKAIGYYVVEHGLIEALDESKANMSYRITIQGRDVQLTSLTYWIEEDAP